MADPLKISALPSALAAILGHILAASNPVSEATEGVTIAQIVALLPSLVTIGAEVDVASAGTVNLTGSPDTFRFRVTGATGITAITLGANKMALLRFAAGPLVTHNATTLILPTGANITAAAGDHAWIASDASGNIRVIAWFRADGTALVGPAAPLLKDIDIGSQTTIASAGTVDLNATPAWRYVITGTATITAFTKTAQRFFALYFNGIMTLTQSGALQLPTGANIVTGNGDIALCWTDTGGNVIVASYMRATGAPLAYGQVEEWIDASQFVPALTNGAQAGIRVLATNAIPVFALAFDAATQEIAWLRWVPRKRYNGGTIRFVPHWTGNGGTAAQTVEFELSGRFYRDDDALDAAPGSSQPSQRAFIVNNDLHIGPISAAITLAGTYVAGATQILLKLIRDVATDTYTVDAEFLGMKIVYTEDKGNDA